MTLPVEAQTARIDAAPTRYLRRITGWLRALPGPLAAILAVAMVFGVTWALLVPPWQAPDETTHFAYTQSLAERFALPGDKRRPAASTDQELADAAVGASVLAFHSKEMTPDWRARDFARYRAEAHRNPERSNGGGPEAASTNPPLYYLYADLAYWAAYRGDAFDRLYAMRIWGVALLMLTVVAAWLLAGEALGPRRLPQLACASIAALFPMETFISTSVNPDALMVTLWTFALWLGARVITRGAKTRDVVGLCAVTAAAILTKATSYALVPAVLLALVLGWRRSRTEGRRAAGRPLAFAAVALAAPVLGWIGLSNALGRPALNTIQTPAGARNYPFNLRQFLVYVWQFYLPRLPWLTQLRTTVQLPVWAIWVREGWAVFGWLEIALPNCIYRVLGAFTALVGVTSTALIVGFRERVRLELIAFFALVLVALLFGLHLTEYRSIIAGQGPILQGRYLLPVLSLFGLAVGLIVSRLPTSWRGPTCGALVAAFLLLQVLALATVAQTYYT